MNLAIIHITLLVGGGVDHVAPREARRLDEVREPLRRRGLFSWTVCCQQFVLMDGVLSATRFDGRSAVSNSV
jgi:hypothetical protein